MGFDGFFFGRIDYQDKLKRLNETTMEMLWSGSKSLGPAVDIFSGVTYNLYQPPPGFCFDIYCSDPEIRVWFECISSYQEFQKTTLCLSLCTS